MPGRPASPAADEKGAEAWDGDATAPDHLAPHYQRKAQQKRVRYAFPEACAVYELTKQVSP